MEHIKNLIHSKKISFETILSKQKNHEIDEGCYVYELEADSTIPSEYILLMHFIGKIDLKLQDKIKKYLLAKQNSEGGWPLFHNGESNISASIKAYFALKLSGMPEYSKEMKKAKKKILAMGGIEESNVFTKISLALFGQISWKTIPFMPIEIIKFPAWFPFNIYKISYWSRTVLVPLLIIMHKKPHANNPNVVSIKELFKKQQEDDKVRKNPDNNIISMLFLLLDKLARLIFPFFPKKYKEDCIEKSYQWILQRLNGNDGLGGIFPAMVNSLIALSLDEKKRFTKESEIASNAIKNLIIEKETFAYCQPCVSPVWDSGWMGHVLLENKKNVDGLVDWFLKKEITTQGDWAFKKKIEPGGWAFQYNNIFYPDVDDTALVGMFLDRYNKEKKEKKIEECIERTRKWILGMQSQNGGWGAFDIDNNHKYLNYIPFADHGALLDPPTSDVSARCLSFLKQVNDPRDALAINNTLNYLLSEQEKDGSWFGRWGTNYIYGTWSVLCALNILKFPSKDKVIQKAAEYLKSTQRPDGGWGEDGKTYFHNIRNFSKKSTPSQTSWALMGLLAAGQINCIEAEKGLKYLLKFKDLNWEEEYFTAVGFPRVFYLKYHGYSKYFPLLAISKIKNQLNLNSQSSLYGV